MRPSNRQPDAMRHVRITRNYTKHAEGSVLVSCLLVSAGYFSLHGHVFSLLGCLPGLS